MKRNEAKHHYHYVQEATQVSDSISLIQLAESVNQVGEKQISLRDHFAGLAMQGIVNSQEYQDGNWESAEITRQSYEISDAMIAARGE